MIFPIITAIGDVVPLDHQLRDMAHDRMMQCWREQGALLRG